MVEIYLTQHEADSLIQIEKHRINEETHALPLFGGSLIVPLVSFDKRENFYLDLSKSRIDFLKGKYQTRARQVIILVRLDFGGAPHRNPDDEEISCPHLHIYREGYGDKWAIPPPSDYFLNLLDLSQTIEDFMRFCNITHPPIFNREIFQ